MAIETEGSVSGLNPEFVEQGVLMDVLDEYDEPAFLNGDKNKPMKVRVRSVRSSAVKAADVRWQKMQTKMARGRRNAQVDVDNHEFVARQAAAMVAELINFSSKTEVQRPDEQEMFKLFNTDIDFQPLRDQVWEFGRKDFNYTTKKADGTENNGGNAVAAPAADTQRSSEDQTSEN